MMAVSTAGAGVRTPSIRGGTGVRSVNGRRPADRPDRWNIRPVTPATTAFAPLDLVLLMSSRH